MAQTSLDPANHTHEFLAGPEVQKLDRVMWVAGKMLAHSGMISGTDYDRMSVAKTRRMTGRVSALRRPVSLTNGQKPDFMINADVYESHISEFKEVLKGPLNEEEAKGLAEIYSAFSAWGKFIFRKLLLSPAYVRSIGRMVEVSGITTDRSDFTDHFTKRLEKTRLEGLMGNVDDSALLQINGLRAGMTLVRAGLQSEGVDPITEDTVLACNAALEAYVGEEGPKYVATTDYLNLGNEQGVTAFAYSVPEWLLVLAVPMSSTKLEPLMGESWVDRIGPRDWNPSVDLIVP